MQRSGRVTSALSFNLRIVYRNRRQGPFFVDAKTDFSDHLHTIRRSLSCGRNESDSDSDESDRHGGRITLQLRPTPSYTTLGDATRYGGEHGKLWEKWARAIAAGTAVCVRCSRPIYPGQAFDLDHSNDRAGPRRLASARCHAEVRGFESHHPLSEPAGMAGFPCPGALARYAAEP